MKPFTTLVASACVTVTLFGCGSSADEEPTPSAAPTQATTSAQDQAASQVCGARDDIQAQVESLSTLTAGSATKADVTTALNSITTDLQKIKGAQPDLAPERKQQVQDAVTAFGTQLEDIVKQAVAGLATSDAKTQAENAAESLGSAVKESLDPIDC